MFRKDYFGLRMKNSLEKYCGIIIFMLLYRHQIVQLSEIVWYLPEYTYQVPGKTKVKGRAHSHIDIWMFIFYVL